MNSCILMAEIIQEPQLRHTPDGMELAEMMVQFPGTRQDDPPSMLRVIGWGNVAKEIYQNHHQGDSVLLEGRLNMNTIDRPEGFKEKRAELTVQRIHLLGGITTNSSPSIPVASSQKAVPSYESQFPTATPGTSSFGVFPQNNPEEPIPQRTNFQQAPSPVAKNQDPDVDDIPF
ncbi:MAG: single-stranded DNA-binding protein [Stigonema ocellatum SAG 48.90 = DSM 106950]|nr:single-stranded DNA-binding protein [Stigonema ocellatum SAG 48.90 = DSM 106950]